VPERSSISSRETTRGLQDLAASSATKRSSSFFSSIIALHRDKTSIILGVLLNPNTQLMSSGRAHQGGILAGYNLTTEGYGLFGCYWPRLCKLSPHSLGRKAGRSLIEIIRGHSV
jgi:hypothetical protein